MTSLAPVQLSSLAARLVAALVVLFAGGVIVVACDSNPTPHPGQNDPSVTGNKGPDTYGGDVSGSPGRGQGEDDEASPNDPTAQPAEPGTDGDFGGAENCPDGADASDGDDAAESPSDASDDDNETTSGDSAEGMAQGPSGDPNNAAESDDCDDDNATPPPAGAADHGRVEDN